MGLALQKVVYFNPLREGRHDIQAVKQARNMTAALPQILRDLNQFLTPF
jgi:hypothetical protein